MKFELQRTGNGAVIVAGGQLTFSNAGRLKKKLLEACAGAGRVDLFLHDVQEADLTLVQLLCAMHRTAVLRGTVLTLGCLDAAGPIRRLIRAAGAERGVGCPDGCLWASAVAAAGGGDDPVQRERREP